MLAQKPEVNYFVQFCSTGPRKWNNFRWKIKNRFQAMNSPRGGNKIYPSSYPQETKKTKKNSRIFVLPKLTLAVILEINYMDIISWAWKSALPCSSSSKGFGIILQCKKIEATVIQLVWHTWDGHKLMTNCKFLCLISFTNLSNVYNMYNLYLIVFFCILNLCYVCKGLYLM